MTIDKTEQRVYASVNRGVLELVREQHKLVLDVGCGAGNNAEVLARSGKTVDGITLSPAEGHLASQWCRKVVVHNLEAGLPDDLEGPYDVCICSHVIEHIWDPKPLLSGIWNIVGPRGRLVVALPNLMHYRTRWELMRGNFDYQQGGIMDSTHVRWYTWKSARKLFEASGFHIERQVAAGSFPLPGIRKIIGRSLAASIDSLATTRFPGVFGWQHIYVMRRAGD